MWEKLLGLPRRLVMVRAFGAKKSAGRVKGGGQERHPRKQELYLLLLALASPCRPQSVRELFSLGS